MKIIASFDDGDKENLRIAELLDKYGLKGIFFVPLNWYSFNILNGRESLTSEDLLSLSQGGHEIGSHTITHPMLTRISLGQAFDEIVNSREIGSIVGKEVTKFCYPKGYAHEDHKNIVRKYYEYGRNTQVGHITEGEDPAWQSTTVHVAGNKRKEYKDTHWLKEALKLLQAARVKKDSIFHLWGHSWEIDKFNEWDNFETLLKELA